MSDTYRKDRNGKSRKESLHKKQARHKCRCGYCLGKTNKADKILKKEMKEELNEYTKEELIKANFHGLTMEDLRAFVNKNPQIKNETKVLVERVEDKYFVNNWKVLRLDGENGKEDFFPAWCISKANDDSIIYIFNHY